MAERSKKDGGFSTTSLMRSRGSQIRSNCLTIVAKSNVGKTAREGLAAVVVFQSGAKGLIVFVESAKDVATLRANPTIRDEGFTSIAHCRGAIAVSTRTAFESMSSQPINCVFSSSGVLMKVDATTSSNKTPKSQDDIENLAHLSVEPA